MRVKLYIFITLSALFNSILAAAQTTLPPYKDSSQPIEIRVQDLLKRMTPEEKFWQCFMIPESRNAAGFKSDYTTGIFGLQVSTDDANAGTAEQLIAYNKDEDLVALAHKINDIQHFFVEKTRLGIPIIPFDEALHGLMRKGATVFPQAIGLAASFNPDLMKDVSAAISQETRLTGIRHILTPVINLANDIRWGRTEETYGEDPYLTSVMGVSFVSSFEENGIVTSPKHFLANVGEGGRDSYPIHWSKRYLEETHLVPFAKAFKEGKSRSVMTSYNLLDGRPSTANHWLLTQKLKEEWGFKGFVISDAGAVGGGNVLHFTAKDYPDATAQAINAGLDVIFQTDYNHYELFIPPFLDGRISQERIDDAVARVLRAKFELGLFENSYVSAEDIKKLKTLNHDKLAEQMAGESFVLLQNNHQTLPISSDVKNILVVGRDAADARLGGYSGPGENKVSILEGMKKYADEHGIKITYTKGIDWDLKTFKIIPENYLSANGQTGLQGTYFSTSDLSGTPALVRQDKTVDFLWTLFSPDPQKISADQYSVRWIGKLTVPETRHYKIGLDGNDGFRMKLNQKEVINRWQKLSYSTEMAEVFLEKGKSYPLEIEFREMRGNGRINLVWDYQLTDYEKDFIDALEKVKDADFMVVVAGIHEGEFQDRALMNLPGNQEQFIDAAAQFGKPTAVILVGGSAIRTNPWRDKVGAILDVWYPGEQGGIAVANTLMGKINPSGKLPITFPAHEGQLPLTYNHQPTGRGDDYHDLSGEPLYPFGFGLSYTQFEFSNLRPNTSPYGKNGIIELKLNVKNTGTRSGKEVVQLYSRNLLSFEARPVIELKAFQKIFLEASEEKEITLKLPVEELKALDEDQNWIINPGNYRLMIGNSSKNLPLKTTITVE